MEVCSPSAFHSFIIIIDTPASVSEPVLAVAAQNQPDVEDLRDKSYSCKRGDKTMFTAAFIRSFSLSDSQRRTNEARTSRRGVACQVEARRGASIASIRSATTFFPVQRRLSRLSY